MVTSLKTGIDLKLPDQGVSVYMSRTLPCIMVFLFGTGWYVTWYVEDGSLWCVGEAMNSPRTVYFSGGEGVFQDDKK